MAKFRHGFVSNSSTTSFVCEVCGVAEGGMDVGLEELGFEECASGHTYCQGHALKVEGININDAEVVKGYMLSILDMLPEDTWIVKRGWRKEIEALDTEKDNDESALYDYYDDFKSEVGGDIERCPICQFKALSASDAKKFFLKCEGITEEAFLKDLASRFSAYTGFKEWLSEK